MELVHSEAQMLHGPVMACSGSCEYVCTGANRTGVWLEINRIDFDLSLVGNLAIHMTSC